ncbi:MAG: rhodanese-like domain-containing protein [Sulfuricaulis sp.]|nr:rhodanese-like domain-containing protein [Sulfuricaulis sp.]
MNIAEIMLFGTQIKVAVMMVRQPILRIFFVTVMATSLAGLARAADKVIAPDTIPGTTKVDAEGVLDVVEKIPHLVIIDARIRQDRVQGYIEGSVSLPDVDTSCESLKKIIPRKSSPVLFYCNGPKCGRSVSSSRHALACGYTQVYWFRGGFEEWKQKNYPFLKE